VGFFMALCAGLVAGCSGEGDDPVVSIGAGVEIRGNVAGDRVLLGREVEIRATSGELSTTTLGSTGFFANEDVAGSGPWLLRVRLRDGGAWYAIAHEDADTRVMTRNVNAFSDLAVRNVFGSAGQSLDDLFGVGDAIDPGALPTATEVMLGNTAVRRLVGDSLAAYDLEELDLTSGDHRNIEPAVTRFLSGHSVFLQDDLVTVFATDPDPNAATRTVIVDGIGVLDDLSAVDTLPPSSPTALRALAAASNEILVVWEPARDNRSVARYEISRNDAVIATTPYPLYHDLPLTLGTEYRYSVVAIDSAGNRSSATPVQVATPLAAPDTTSPLPPTNLSAVSGPGHVRLSWTGSADDTASYQVLRSVAGGMLDVQARLTSTGTVDTGLTGGLRYCYRVVAVDASDNPSAESDSACTTPPAGNDLGDPVDTGTPTPGPAGTGLVEVDVSAIVCDEEFTGAVISSAITLDAACYRVVGNILVADGGVLTVSAGTVLKFGEGAALIVSNGGALNASGTADFPIVFSGTRQQAGHWAGVRFENTGSELNRLEQVVIENAGLAEREGVALALVSSESDATRLSVNSLLVRRSAGLGFAIDAGTQLDRFDAVVVTDSALPGRLPAMLAGRIGAGSSFRGNRTDLMEVQPAKIERMTTWPQIDVPWDVVQMTVDAPFFIPPGSELQFGISRGIYVGVSGSFRAVGTAAAPIVITGTLKEPGYWDGISFAYSTSPDNRLEHVIIEYAGNNEESAGLSTRSSGSRGSYLSLDSVSLRFNEGGGFRFESLTQLGDFDNVTSTANDYTGTLSPDLLPAIGSGFMGTGNAEDVIVLNDATVRESSNWPDPGVPYVFQQIELAAPVTIAAGTRLMGSADAEFRITPTGALSAVGTPSAPISFMGTVASPGHWQGLSFDSSNATTNRLEHVSVLHGGGGVAPATSGNIALSCSASRGVVLSIEDARIGDSGGWGIYRQGSTCQLTLESGVSFEGNALGDVSPP